MNGQWPSRFFAFLQCCKDIPWPGRSVILSVGLAARGAVRSPPARPLPVLASHPLEQGGLAEAQPPVQGGAGRVAARDAGCRRVASRIAAGIDERFHQLPADAFPAMGAGDVHRCFPRVEIGRPFFPRVGDFTLFSPSVLCRGSQVPFSVFPCRRSEVLPISR